MKFSALWNGEAVVSFRTRMTRITKMKADNMEPQSIAALQARLRFAYCILVLLPTVFGAGTVAFLSACFAPRAYLLWAFYVIIQTHSSPTFVRVSPLLQEIKGRISEQGTKQLPSLFKEKGGG